MSKALTVRTVENIKPADARREIPDGYLPGLYFIVQPSGAKSWAVRYRHNGETRKYTLGPYPALDLVTARDLARTALIAKAKGEDPAEAKKRAVASGSDSIAAVAQQFVERHCKRKYRARTLRDAQRYLDKYIVDKWGARPIGEISRRDVREMLDRIVDDSPVTANRLHSVCRKFFGWALEHEVIPASPVAGLKPPAVERSRDRILDDRELAKVWRSAASMGWPYGALVQLLILTGARRSEVAGMRWDEIALDRGLWTLPADRVKNGRVHEVPLSRQAVAIIKGLPRVNDSPHVFSLNGESSINGWGRNKRQIDKVCGVAGWTLHDLRRTAASGMAKLGVSLPVIEKVLNHVSGSFARIVGIYQRHDYADEKRKALQRWANHVEGLVSSKPAKAASPARA